MQEEDQMLLDYMPWDATSMPHIPSLLACWFQILFSNWFDEQWDNRDVSPLPQFNKLWLQLKLKEVWEPNFPQWILTRTTGDTTTCHLKGHTADHHAGQTRRQLQHQHTLW